MLSTAPGSAMAADLETGSRGAQPPAGVVSAPASFAQERLWFVSRYHAGSPAYNSALALHLRGALDPQALQQALNGLRKRHQVLRASFDANGEGLRQVIALAADDPLPVVDLAGAPESDRAARRDEFADQVAGTAFNLDAGPLMIARLARLAEDEHLLVMAFHHTVFDGWSRTIAIRDLAELYEAALWGRTPDLPPLPLQYPDYAAWQRQQLSPEKLAELMVYWRAELAGVAPLELPTDHPRPNIRSTAGQAAGACLPFDLTQSIKAFSRRQRATLYTTLVSAMQVLLHRYTDQDDLTVGFPVAGRTRKEFEELIGVFINTLVLRADFRSNPRFTDFLRCQRQRLLGAIEHQAMPFGKLVQGLQVTRLPSQSPLFQVMMQVRNYPAAAFVKGGLAWAAQRPSRHAAQFELSFSAFETSRGLQLRVEYNSDLFEPETITRLLGHYQVLLRGIIEQPDRRVSELPLLSEDERRALLVDWNRTEAPYPAQASLPDLFLAQAARHPDRLAAVRGERVLTYRELQEQSQRLAQHLIWRGCGLGSRVGLCVDRSFDIPVGAVGIMRAGAACVPLEPNYPPARLQFMVEDAEVSLIVASDRLRGLADQLGCPVLTMGEARNGKAAAEPLPDVGPDAIAFVTYTSGSTGRPKAVPVPHRGCVSLLANSRDLYTPEAVAACLLGPSIAFDACLRSVYVPLVYGGCLVITEKLFHLAATIPRMPITLIITVPSAMAALLRHGPLPEGLHTVMFSGEVLSADLAQRVYSSSSARRVFNQYGPTETTWYCLQAAVPRECTEEPPLGRPLANVRVYVLDKCGNPVPRGVRGELYIGGVGVVAGYLNRPELSRERFLPDPFAPQTGARMYRTGDIVRYDQEGRLHFIGRTDFQVKIRGCRVELQEVEAALAQHPAVAQAVVTARAETTERQGLAAYVVPRQGQSVTASDLRQALRQQLPAYMVPSLFMMLPELPLKPNGKVDRQALPEPTPTPHEAPSEQRLTPLESSLLQLWAAALERPEMGVDDNFFELGGHSLLAARLFALLSEKLDLQPPLAMLFEAPTVREFAAALARRMPAHA